MWKGRNVNEAKYLAEATAGLYMQDKARGEGNREKRGAGWQMEGIGNEKRTRAGVAWSIDWRATDTT